MNMLRFLTMSLVSAEIRVWCFLPKLTGNSLTNFMVLSSVLPRNGVVPVNISYIKIPRHQ